MLKISLLITFISIIVIIITFIVVCDIKRNIERKKLISAFSKLELSAKKELENMNFTVLDTYFIERDSLDQVECFFLVKDNISGRETTYMAKAKNNEKGFELEEDDFFQFL